MGEIERLHQQRMAKQAEQPKGERKDPTEWRPRDNRDYYEEQVTVTPERMRSEPLNYDSLVTHPERLSLIEATALANLRQVMNRTGLHPDERSLRVHWQLVVEGQGYKCPEGFIHPEAPEDVQRESQAAWKRCVELATDSLANVIFVRVWRKRQRSLPAPKPKEIES